MTLKEIDEYNMKYLELDQFEYNSHKRLMNMNMDRWNPKLFAYVKNRCNELGLCADVISGAVAEYIKTLRVK